MKWYSFLINCSKYHLFTSHFIIMSGKGLKCCCNKVQKSRKITCRLHENNLLKNANKLKSTEKRNQSKLSSNVEKPFEVLGSPIKSDSDNKEYRVIRLKNGLTACLVSDNKFDENETIIESESESEEESGGESGSASESDHEEGAGDSDEEVNSRKKPVSQQRMAASGLCVGVGSFSDPKNVPGMAHFLEHMVFMGSKKYPKENDFDAFIKKNGGFDNAATDMETTCFYFEILQKHFEKALDKFAQFFIAPLMKKNAMQREREAIESEFQMALPSDTNRVDQILFSTAKIDSPINSFSWGNLITLKQNISDEELYKGVHEFRKRHYSAHRMTLALQANLPLDTLQKFVVDSFAKVPNNGLPPDNFSKYRNLFDTPDFRRIYYVKPVKGLYQLDLVWELPSLRDKYRTKPLKYLAYLLGDEGKGSLLSYLRKNVWVLGTVAGNSESDSDFNSMYSLFTVTLILTETGLDHIFEIIEIVYSYINMLKNLGPQERIFNEIKTINETSFRFRTEEPAADFVEELCQQMQLYPQEHYIAGDELLFDYDAKAIENATKCLAPEKMCIFLLSNKLPDAGLNFDSKEKWFGTEYTSREIPQDWLKKWQQAPLLDDLSIPEPNPFITTNFSLLPSLDYLPEYPEKISTSTQYELWYRKDEKFNFPMAYFHLYLISPVCVENAESLCKLDMLNNLLGITITEKAYPAANAELKYYFSPNDRGLTVKVYGFNENLLKLLALIATYLKQINSNITEELFEGVKKKLLLGYQNKLIKPSTLSKDLRMNLIVKNYYTPVERYAATMRISLKSFRQFVDDYFKKIFVRALVQGNVSAEEAKKCVKGFVDVLGAGKVATNEYPMFGVVQLPQSEKCCRIQAFNQNDANSVVTNYYQAGKFNIRNSSILALIMQIIEEPLFDILRTKEQLGYNVYCSMRDTFGVLGFTITVNCQATKSTTNHVDNRIEAFIQHCADQLLSKITPEEFLEHKSSLIKMKQIVDVDLKEEVDRNWAEITGDDFVFDRNKQEIAAIEQIEFTEMLEWWKEFVGAEKSMRRKLSIQIVGFNTKEREVKLDSDNLIEDEKKIVFLGSEDVAKNENKAPDYFICNIEKFKKALTVFPVENRFVND